MRNKSIFLEAVLIMLLIGLLQKVYSQNIAQDISSLNQDKKDIAKDTADIKDDVTDRKGDAADIKSDRQALRDAVTAGDQNKIQQAREKLRRDINVTRNNKPAETKKAKGNKHHKRSGFLKAGVLNY